MLAAINWTNVLVALIAGLPGIIAALYAGSVHGQIKLPSGKSIGEAVEYAHDTAIANNLLLSKANGETTVASTEALHEQGKEPPQVPAGTPGDTP